MKYKISLGSLVALSSLSLALATAASAQPRPQPPTGLRPLPGAHPDPHADPHAARDEHHEAEHQETEAQIRARLLKEQQDDRTKRQVERKDSKAWEASRAQRAAEARGKLNTTWGSLAEKPEAKAELATHAERMAQLNRILDVAQEKGDSALVTHTNAVIQREIARDTRAMQAIRAKEGVR
jgi:hypothetical protein